MLYYQVTVPPTFWLHGNSSNFIINVDAETPEDAAVSAVKQTAGYHWGPYTATSLTADEVKATGRVHPAPADEVVVCWHSEGYNRDYAVTVARPKPKPLLR